MVFKAFETQNQGTDRRVQHSCMKMHFSINLLILIFPAIVLSSTLVDPYCNVEECAEVIDQSGCWNFAKSKNALLACVPKGTAEVSLTKLGYKYTNQRTDV